MKTFFPKMGVGLGRRVRLGWPIPTENENVRQLPHVPASVTSGYGQMLGEINNLRCIYDIVVMID